MTAAAFAKGFLDLEGELPPILVGLVRRDGINSLLDETVPAERGDDALTTYLEASESYMSYECRSAHL